MNRAPSKVDPEPATLAALDHPRVSIIIPTYNHAQYLGDAIQSVLDQTRDSFEIIVVDDGSTDNTRTIAGQFGNQVRYIWQENQGLSAARNTGIRAARGEFIGFLDADDVYAPNFLSTLLPLLETNPEVGMVYCGFQFIDAAGKLLPQVQITAVPASRFYAALLNGNFLAAHCVLARQRSFEKVGLFDEVLQACEDWDMWLRIARRFKVIGVGQILAHYRLQPGSMSTHPQRMLANRLVVIRKHFGSEPVDNSLWPTTPQRAYSRAYLAATIEYLQANDVERAYQCFHQMATIEPKLLTELEPFYELGCGDQPKGSRGNFATLNLSRNAALLIDMLTKFFDEPPLLPAVKKQKRHAYANAYLALGLLSYGAGQFRESRRFLLRAIAAQPGYSFKRSLITTLVKSLVGTRLRHRLELRRRENVL